MAKKGAKNNDNYNRPNLYGMIQNIVIAAINKGQLLLMGVVLLMAILEVKMTPASAEKVSLEIINEFRNYHLIGWGLFICSGLLWFFTSKRSRIVHAREMDRVAKEKTELQKKIHGKLPSTRD